MAKEQNQVWRFFASVKLALTIIFTLAATSIFGTIIQQNKSEQFYVQEYGPEMTRLLQMLDIIPNMYGSWWFITLLIIFSVNLIVCSIDRLPNAWRMVTLDNLQSNHDRLDKMPLKAEMTVQADLAAAGPKLQALLRSVGWKAESREKDGGVMLFAQKGAWSRLGAYVIHVSILVVFLGALIGSVFGYKASIMFPEGATIDYVFERGSGQPIDLGFEMHLENFDIKYYPTGMVREYRSDLVITDPESAAQPWRVSVLVNHPLKYRGLTFYQSSYEPLSEFMINVRNPATGNDRFALVPPGRQVNWPDEEVVFGVMNTSTDRTGRVHEFQIWFDNPGAEPSVFNMRDKQTVTVQRPNGEYTFYIQQRYATGLQVANDPGVWVVYLGFALMCLGLYITFMVTHRRIWAWLTPDGKGGTRLLLCGGSNRNKASFDQRFAELAERLRRDQAIS